MDRRAVPPSSADDHWAPEHLVIARTVLAYAGPLLVERDSVGEVLLSFPLEDMAAVEQRYPAWARGPFGRIEPDRTLPGGTGVYALVQAGVVHYVGASTNLARTFSARGLGAISRRECQQAKHEEICRLNRLITAEALADRLVDLYVLPVGTPSRMPFVRQRAAPVRELGARLADAAHGRWHLPR